MVKHRAMLLVVVLIFAPLVGGSAAIIQKVLPKLGLVSDFPKVVGLPPGSVKPNAPAYSGPHPSTTPRPDETYPFPIPYGETGPAIPLFAGDNQYPFLCQTSDSRLGQPLIDNHHGWGVPVFAKTLAGKRTDQVIGYSKDCLLPTRHHYLYFSKPDDRSAKRQNDHHLGISRDIHLLVRAETGTINRHLYSILIPTTFNDQIDKPDLSRWNGKLIYYFRGGISIGFQQGKMRLTHIAKKMRELLNQGYAVVFSSATETDNTYNIRLQEDTALRLKHQFTSRYGKPKFTIGFGGSGGAIQQFLFSQNHPGIIDGSVAVVAYPDMITQIHYTLDCELLEYYFDHIASDKHFWQSAANRQAVMGLSTNYAQPPRLSWLYRLSQLLNFNWPHPQPPGSECSSGWRGSTALINNPKFHSDGHRFSESVRSNTPWTHWQDNQQVYGTDEEGRAPSLWSNQGVQYGLSALQNDVISAHQFLELNSRIGSWIEPQQMTQERLWYLSMDSDIRRFSPYGEHNMTHRGKIRNLAPRYNGNLEAAKAAYRSGLVFVGALNTPMIDVRMYLDHKLDIHHTFASGSARERIIEAGYDAGNHVIWTAKAPHNPMWEAVQVMDQWLTLRQQSADLRPQEAEDSCFDSSGQVIARGRDVWDGKWNQQATGKCQRQMPFHQSSRQVAGEAISGYTFQCHLIPVSEALAAGLYAPKDMRPYQRQLEQIFPQGVCDFRQGDRARPTSL